MGQITKKFGLLLWKNYTIQTRHIVQTVVEILIPLIFTIILIIIRGQLDVKGIAETRYPEFEPKLDVNGTAVPTGSFILYAPNTDQNVINVMNAVERKFNAMKLNYTFVGHTSEAMLLKQYKNNPQYATNILTPANALNQFLQNPMNLLNPMNALSQFKNANPVLAAVVFKSLKPNTIKYLLRFPASLHNPSGSPYLVAGLKPRWLTELLYEQFPLPRDRDHSAITDNNIRNKRGGTPGYWSEGFLFLQATLDSEITRAKAAEYGKPDIVDSFSVKLNRYPYPRHLDDKFAAVLQTQFPFLLMLSFQYSIINIAKSVTHEKEKRLKESMKIMGLPNWLHWTAWFTKSFIFLLLSTILLTAFYKIRWYGNGLAVLTYSDASVIFLFLMSYVFATITFGFLISTWFSTANSAATASGVMFFLTYFPYIFFRPRYLNLSRTVKFIACIFSNIAMAFGCQIIAILEGSGEGIKWNSIRQPFSPDDTLSLLDMIFMLIFDGILYFLLAIYIEAVHPGEYGVPLPWNFPFTKWYWVDAPQGGAIRDASVSPIDITESGEHEIKSEFFEREPKGYAGIRMVGLTKIFGKKVAVKDLHLNFYENQVTALLGHNGAGKTTTMSMLTGLFTPTSGTAIVNGFDIRNDIKSVRESLGLCPQHDVLFDEMTVEEHLKFFCLLKGASKKSLSAEIDHMLGSMMLEDKRGAQSRTLSGGMKRKLSVGIALIGGSKVVLLDEPTSGMDPGARRSTWDLITSEKKGRTIVLSTHFMDEADILGDRIAIMAEGQAQCCGSSLFLKKKYGGGYHLIIVKEVNCNVSQITEFIQKHIPEVHVDQNIGAELSYSLPDEKSSMFPEIFEELEQRKHELGIASYGCSITQMEEVFMRVGEMLEESMPSDSSQNVPHKSSRQGDVSNEIHNDVHETTSSSVKRDVQGSIISYNSRNYGIKLLLQQFWAMLVKKWLYTRRNIFLVIAQLSIPVIFLIFTLIMLKTLPNIAAPKERVMDLSQYYRSNKPVTTVQCVNGGIGVCHLYKRLAKKKSDIEDTFVEDIQDYILKKSKKNLPLINSRYIVGLKATKNDKNLTGYFNNKPYHTLPLAMNLITNAVLQDVTGNNKLTLTVSNYPLPFQLTDKVENLVETESEGYSIGLNINFGMSFVSASFAVFIIKERETNSKHLQLVSGVRYPIFWLAHFIFDMFIYFIPVFLLMIILLIFQAKDYSNENVDMQGYFFLVLLLYGWSAIPLMYLFSFLSTVPSAGYTKMSLFNFTTGMTTFLTMVILQLKELGLEDTANTLEWVFMIFPNFDLGYALSLLTINRQLHLHCPPVLDLFKKIPFINNPCDFKKDWECCEKYPKDYLSWKAPGIGRHLFYMFVIGLTCMIILSIMESHIVEKLKCGLRKNEVLAASNAETDPKVLEDDDVTAENSRVRLTDLKELFQTENMVLKDLTKYYGSFLAVDRLCLGVKPGECFGLLGVNGAGKTTTFKMLTGDIPITAGDAFIINRSVKSQIKEVQKVLGYCPQFDALIPELTGRETIFLFARLRGIQEWQINKLANTLGDQLIFRQHMDKPCGTYSGGNKRKLSTALALIGNPPLVFLDEPTTGMDPVARRHLWNTILNVRETGASVILTSHSMEECEALCTRLAIMVNGKFRCLGSGQHLKNKFGDGYALIAKMAASEQHKPRRTDVELGGRKSSLTENQQTWEQELEPLKSFIEASFPDCHLKEIHPLYLHYHIKQDHGITWGGIFRKMEEAKVLFGLEAYSVGQTTLEQVFLSFTQVQS